MKNIHVLPTDKPSRLYKDGEKLKLDIESYGVNNQNIYITSDSEIKEGDWVVTPNKTIMLVTTKYTTESSFMIGNSKHKGSPYYIEFCRKIILTTDQDLISKTCVHNFVNIINDGFECTKCKKHVLRSKITVSDTIDGVQSIDDEFLEWFVKNPSCSYIEWSSERVEGSFDGENWKYNYGVVIPKEETLEEAKQRILDSNYLSLNDADIFEMGAKWQAERMYSEEEVQLILSKLLFDVKHKKAENSVKWFEQFKKK